MEKKREEGEWVWCGGENYDNLSLVFGFDLTKMWVELRIDKSNPLASLCQFACKDKEVTL